MVTYRHHDRRNRGQRQRVYECRATGLRDDLRVLLIGHQGTVSSVIVRRDDVRRRIDCVHVVIASLGGSEVRRQGPLGRTPGELLASSIVTMCHIVLIAHGDLLALIASEFQVTANVGRD